MEINATVRRCVLLAAGRGTRLGALTAHQPKPMIRIGSAPLLEHILVGLRGAGIHQFLMVVGYRADAIRSYFGDGARWDAQIDYVLQERPNGTGAALLLGREFADGEPVLMSFGDILTDYAHYHALVGAFTGRPCAGVLGINPVDDPASGAAVYRNGDRVTRVVEKPPPGTSESHWNLAGVHVFGPEVFDALAAIEPSPRGEYELTSAITALLAAGREIRACELTGYWSDVGSPEALAEAERTWGR